MGSETRKVNYRRSHKESVWNSMWVTRIDRDSIDNDKAQARNFD